MTENLTLLIIPVTLSNMVQPVPNYTNSISSKHSGMNGWIVMCALRKYTPNRSAMREAVLQKLAEADIHFMTDRLLETILDLAENGPKSLDDLVDDALRILSDDGSRKSSLADHRTILRCPA